MLMWLLVLIVGVLAYVVGTLGRPAVLAELKRFGLEEARAAAEFVSSADQAKAVKAVVVGVLHYIDVVQDEAEEEESDLLEVQGMNDALAKVYVNEIAALQAKISSLKNANAGIDSKRTELAALRKLFS